MGTGQKKIFIVVLSVFVIAFFIMPLFLFQFYKDSIVRRTLNEINTGIDGKLTVERVNVDLSRIEVKKPCLSLSDGRELVTAEALSLKYNLLHLLFVKNRASAIKDITLRSPRVVLERDVKGNLTFSRLLGKRKPEVRWQAELGAFRGSIHIQAGTIEFQDRQKGTFTALFTPVTLTVKPNRKSSFLLSLSADEKGPGATRYRLQGSVDLRSPRIDMDLSGEAINLSSWGTYFLSSLGISVTGGTGSFEVALRGSAPELDKLAASVFMAGKVTLRQGALSHRGALLDMTGVEGVFELHRDLLSIKECRGKLNGAPFTVKGSLSDFAHPSVDLAAAVKGLSLQKIGHLPPLKNLKPLKGKVSLEATCRGTPQSPCIDVLLNCSSGVVNGYTIADTLIEGRYEPGGLHITRATSTLNGGRLAGNGWIFFPSSQVVFYLKGSGAALGWHMEKGGDIKTTADYDVMILGDLSHPTVLGNAAASSLRVGSESFDASSAHFLMAGTTLLVRDSTFRKEKGMIWASGIVDLKGNECALQVRTLHYPIPAALIPGLAPVGGEISSMFHCLGPLSSPLVYGAISDGSLVAGKNALSGLFVPFATDGSVVTVSRGSAMFNGSPVSLDGSMLLSPSPFLKLSLMVNNSGAAALGHAFFGAAMPAGALAFRGTITGGPDVGFLWNATASLDKGTIRSRGIMGQGKSGHTPFCIAVIKGKTFCKGDP